MAEGSYKRKLTAVFSADVVGYSRLMGEDEAATCSMAGRDEEARAAAKEALRINPKFSVERYMRTQPLKDPAARERLAQAFKKAGLPD